MRKTFLLLLLASVLVVIPTYAQTGTAQAAPQGAALAAYVPSRDYKKHQNHTLAGLGTAESPYLIADYEDLAFLAYVINANKAPSSETGALLPNQNDQVYFQQTADIDCEGKELYPIGTGDTPFYHVYDGQGFAIKNFTMVWNECTNINNGGANNYYGAHGLFGLVTCKEVNGTRLCGEVKFLNIVGAHFRANPAFQTLSGTRDVVNGVVAGCIARGGKIHDISIRQCRMDDDDLRLQNKTFKTNAIYMAGAIGELGNLKGVNNLVDKLGNESDEPHCEVYNIFANVDIKMNVTTNGNETSIQCYSSGIVGRVRRGRYSDMPKNVVVSGSIDWAVASIGTVYGGMRVDCDQKHLKDIIAAWAGEYNESKGTDWSVIFGSSTSDHRPDENGLTDYDKQCFFYDFSINSVPINRTSPASKGVFHTRPLENNASDGNTQKPLDDTYNMRTTHAGMFQGYNCGTPISTPLERKSLLEMFNVGAINQRDDMAWRFDTNGNDLEIVRSAIVVGSRKSVHTFQAKVIKYSDAVNNYTLNFYVIKKGELVDGQQKTTINPTSSDPADQPWARGVRLEEELVDQLKVASAEFSFTKELYDAHGYTNYIHDVYRLCAVLCDQNGNPVQSNGSYIYNYMDPMPLVVTCDRSISNDNNDRPSEFLYTAHVMGGERDYTIQGANNSYPELRYEWAVQKLNPTTLELEWANPYYGETPLHYTKVLPATYARGLRCTVTDKITGATLLQSEQTIRPVFLSIKSSLEDPEAENPTRNFSVDIKDDNNYDWGLRTSWIVKWQLIYPGYDGTIRSVWLNGDFTNPSDPNRMASQREYSLSREAFMRLAESLGDPSGYDVLQYTMRAYLYGSLLDPAGNFPYIDEEDCAQIYIDIDESTPMQYTATIRSKLTGKPIGDDILAGGTWTWYRNEDPSYTGGWVEVPGVEEYGPTLYNVDTSKDMWYYARWQSASGKIDIHNTVGTARLIFVYNRDTTLVHQGKADGFDGFDYDYDNGPGLPKGRYYPDGDDSNPGTNPHQAVKTMRRAYQLLDADATNIERNRIVVMGYYDDEDWLRHNDGHIEKTPDAAKVAAYRAHFGKPAIITGSYGRISGGTVYIHGVEADPFDLYAPLQLQSITLYGPGTAGGIHTIINCNYCDFTVGRDVRMKNYPNMNTTSMGLQTTDKVPYFTIVSGNYNNNSLDPIQYSPYNREENASNINIQSGAWGRIIGAGRNNGAVNTTSHNLTGRPDDPSRVRIVINITHEEDANGNRDLHEYTPGNKTYTHDIGLVCGGQTDGSLYGFCTVTINDGHIGRYIAGNITYGRSVNENGKVKFPDDSFFGRTILNLHGGEIDELFGGSLGRYGSGEASHGCNPYFYGTSIINMYGGTVNTHIYASGAGGVTGIGREADLSGVVSHTNDKYIPYYKHVTDNKGDYTKDASGKFVRAINGDGDYELLYDTFDALKAEDATFNHVPLMYSLAGEEINLAQSHAEINLYGGIVKGNVYGGGFGYSNVLAYDKAPISGITWSDGTKGKIGLSGVLFGTSLVTMQQHPVYGTTASVEGNIYGGGAGDATYEERYQASLATGDGDTEPTEPSPAAPRIDFSRLGLTFGDTNVQLSAGTVGGDVYGGAQGVELYNDMATVYGSANLVVGGTVDIHGNIYGGGQMSNICKHHDGTETDGNTYVNIEGGIIGNCIFGGGNGFSNDFGHADMSADVEGSTFLKITGGSFSIDPYVDKDRQVAKGFNIYGGGYHNSTIQGDTHLDIKRSLFTDLRSMPSVGTSMLQDNDSYLPDYEEEESQNTGTTPAPMPTVTGAELFAKAWADVAYRHFCVYGGGWGEQTMVKGNTDVKIDIPLEGGFVCPNENQPMAFRSGQHFFDVAGGGYNGNVGYFDKGNRKKQNRFIDEYKGGQTSVTIMGYPYLRKVFGGGFYANCATTQTTIESGAIEEVYGGSLMGYVYESANLIIGNQLSKGDDSPATEKAVKADLNSRLIIFGSVYGGNDVKGIVGTDFWRDNDGHLGIDYTDNGPLYTACIDSLNFSKGVHMWLWGGTIKGNVYGGGNGHYRGYYVPDWTRYNDGPERQYRYVRGWDGSTYEDEKKAIEARTDLSDVEKDQLIRESQFTHRVYRNRPMTGLVHIIMAGNSETDRLRILGNFYGGGRSCTIGSWNTILPFEDPRRLVKGGYLHVNFGSHITVNDVYMGSRGELMKQQVTVPSNVSLKDFGKDRIMTTQELDRLGISAYGHWWWNPEAPNWVDPSKKGRYEPGFPVGSQKGGNTGLYGEHMHRGYMRNYEMNGDLELTFYQQPYETNAAGELQPYESKEKYPNNNRYHRRRQWVPGEFAVERYDATDIHFRNFFLGGECGSMTNNRVMFYTYGKKVVDGKETNDTEKYGVIYRVVLPRGLTIRDKAVMGSEYAVIKYYMFTDYNGDETYTGSINDTFHTLAKTKVVDGKTENVEPVYTYNGGLVTHTTFSYDLAYYNYKILKGGKPNDHLNDGSYLPADWDKTKVPNAFWKGPNAANENMDNTYHEGDTLIVRGDYLHFLRHPGEYLSLEGHGLSECTQKDDNTEFYTRVKVDTDGTPLFDTSDPEDPEKMVTERAVRDQYGLALWQKDGFVNPNTLGTKPNRVAYMGMREKRATGTAVKLTSVANFKPHNEESAANDHSKCYGGIIYGGCYTCGLTMGDIVLNVGSDMIGAHIDDNSARSFNELAQLKLNLGRVFGGGFGRESVIRGNTYVNLLRNVRAFNVFGGGQMGTVEGKATVNYVGTEESYIFGSIYGGGLCGDVGDGKNYATHVNLFSGNVSQAYGGSCIGNLKGGANVYLCDEVFSDLDHLDYARLTSLQSVDDWSNSRLIVGSVYGGNDISGEITSGILTQKEAEYTEGSETKLQQHVRPGSRSVEADGTVTYTTYDAYVLLREEESANDVTSLADSPRRTGRDGSNAAPNQIPAKDTPGAVNGYNGFPLVGNLFAGSNGAYGEHTPQEGSGADDEGRRSEIYAENTWVELASGIENNIYTVNLHTGDLSIQTTDDGNVTSIPYVKQTPYTIPHLHHAYVGIEGGTAINVYGGGDQATVGCVVTDPARKGSTTLHVDYNLKNFDARAGFRSRSDLERVWNVCDVKHDQQIKEVVDTIPVLDAQGERLKDEDGNPAVHYVFKYQLYRIFGGNNRATMNIQPTWNLGKAYVGSIYSGGNFGNMTYFESATATEPAKGLKLVVDAPKLHAHAVYGGGRVGNINPDVPENFTDPDFYGATLEVKQGVIDQVYGGNDVAGNVYYGTNVRISGAISGNVYCAGNGNYIYKYDPSLEVGKPIEEAYDDQYGGRYFILPRLAGFGDDSPTPSQILLAINNYRPDVDRTKMTLAGESAIRRASVYGSVYMGGNSSSISRHAVAGELTDIEFEIGDHVLLNSVYMGSNGENMADGEMIRRTELANHIDFTNEVQLTAAEAALMEEYGNAQAKVDARIWEDKDHYPHLLDVYMRAVETEGMPNAFKINDNLTDAYIGDFFVGGNNGSMTTTHSIDLTFPKSLVIYGKIVGGCNNGYVTYKDVTHYGGLDRYLDQTATIDEPAAPESPTVAEMLKTKVHLKVHSRFMPKRLEYPLNGDIFSIRLVDELNDADGNPVFRNADGTLYKEKLDEEGTTTQEPYTGKTYYSRGRCNIYGGCYNSGITLGDVLVDVYSDMINYGESPDGPSLDLHRQTVVNGINDKSWRTFSVIGGGYGSNTRINGSVEVRLLPDMQPKASTVNLLDEATPTQYELVQHPSCGALFAGSQEGIVVGCATTELRDGTVLANMYGASEARPLYGSTQIIVGYPEYYICNRSDEYHLLRADVYSKGIDKQNADGSDVVKKSVWYRKGDLLSDNVYDLIKAYDEENGTTQASNFTRHPHDHPELFNAHWDDIDIHVGDPTTRKAQKPEDITSNDKYYFGHGNIYGGGFISTQSQVSLAGQNTVCRYIEGYTPEPLVEELKVQGYSEEDAVERAKKFGGNSTVMVWDNQDNNDYSVGWTAGSGYSGKTKDDSTLKDHITIGTYHYVPVTLHAGDDKMGLYFYDETAQKMVHQPSSAATTADEADADGKVKNKYYKIEADGGIYGDGRKVFCEGFRTCDLAFYGYADFTPQSPKLMNTFQRADLLTVTDCCIHLQGANDFATNSTDATIYSLTRIGELHMQSSLSRRANDVDGKHLNIEPGVRDSKYIGNIIHDKPRSRNFMAFHHSVHYLGAFVSNEDFDNYYHGADGVAKQDESGTNPSYTSNGSTYQGYRGHKAEIVDTYYAAKARAAQSGGDAVTDAEILAFKKRNLGTAANMLGINNGYQLKIQSAWTTRSSDSPEVDHIYYGPAIGVAEVKLLTLAAGEGGGYIYALNHHKEVEDASSEESPKPVKTPNFLQDLGNFVFPGAAFKSDAVTGDHDTEQKFNYIIDDCFPVGHGYDVYKEHKACNIPKAEQYSHDAANVNVNREQEIHYWYVEGDRYFFNATMTAVTSTKTNESGPRDVAKFHLNNDDNLIFFAGIDKNTKEIRLEEVKWLDTDGNLHFHDLTRRDDNDQLAIGTDLTIGGYQLYVSLDSNPNNEYTSSQNGSWVAEVKRDGYKLAFETGGAYTPDAVNPEYMIGETGRFGNKTIEVGGIDKWGNPVTETKTETNEPRLGIMLIDAVDNNAADYYQQHLSMPAQVTLKIGAKNQISSTANPTEVQYHDYTYTVNLTIQYIKGASVRGHIVIENCALPGEVIYANAFDVVPEADDENMYISERRWELYKDESDQVGINITDACKIDVNNEKRIAIPAYYWMNGWKLRYKVKTNGESATVYPSAAADFPTLKVHNYHRMYAWDYTTYLDAAMTKHDVQDLQLVSGARVYIENARDMKRFEEYMKSAAVTEDAPAATATDEKKAAYNERHRGHIDGNGITLYLDEMYDDKVHVNPQNATNIHFILLNDIDMDEAENADNTSGSVVSARDGSAPSQTPYKNEIVFGGTFSGMGHTIKMGHCTQFIKNTTNSSRFYHVGFYSSRSDVTVFKENHGRMLACFYYNDNESGAAQNGANENTLLTHRGQLLPATAPSVADCDIQYCFQNTAQGHKDHYENDTYYNDLDFMFGSVGYKLNVLYLNERYKRNTSNEGNQNPNYKAYVPNFYYDGEYRFAKYDPKGVGVPTALRTDMVPNYKDHLKRGLIPAETQYLFSGVEAAEYGMQSTNHNVAHLVDELRAVYKPKASEEDEDVVDHYEPVYPLDYIFFGQELTATDDYQRYPHAITPETRIYRASGFYGSQTDRAFHFNRECVARHPQLTAIDFTGQRSRDRVKWYREHTTATDIDILWKTEHQKWPEGAAEKDLMQSVYYPPVLDLPTDAANNAILMGSVDPEALRLESFTSLCNPTVDDVSRITKNLLVYVSGNEKSAPMVKSALAYTENMLPSVMSNAPASEPNKISPYDENFGVSPEGLGDGFLQPDDQNYLMGHCIEWDGTNYAAKDGLFHLVDKQDFNAPISFSVTKRAWYYRLPATFSNGNTAWEGIYLPFTIKKVLASDYSPYNNPIRSHGEVSHFYGAERGKGSTEGENIRHEYWLRSLTGYHSKGGKDLLEFTRPDYKNVYRIATSYQDEQGNVVALDHGNYHYSNTWFYDAYGTNSSAQHQYNSDHVLQQYQAAGRDFANYPYLTKNVPYIISFPGKKYYEFSMSGEFYAQQYPSTPGVFPQIITYEQTVPEGGQAFEIPITDQAPQPVIKSQSGSKVYKLAGTFAHRSLDANQMVVIVPATQGAATTDPGSQAEPEPAAYAGSLYDNFACDLDGRETRSEIDNSDYEDSEANGTYFAHRDLVRPFRVFLTVPQSSTSDETRAYIGYPVFGDESEMLPGEPEAETLDEELTDDLRVWVHNGQLHIYSTCQRSLSLYSISGIRMAQLEVPEGTSVYPGIRRGAYIVAGKKVAIK